MQITRTIVSVLLALTICGASAAQVIDSQVDDNVFSSTVALADVEIEVSATFDQPTSLSVAELGHTAAITSPLALLGRLSLSTPLALPILLKFAPPTGGGSLTHRGPVEIELYTNALPFVVGSPLRIFAADAGGTFHDVTAAIAPGSFRVTGHQPEVFGDFLVITDLRSVDQVIGDKLAWLDASLTQYGGSIEPTVLADLESRLAIIEQHVDNGAVTDAIQATSAFLTVVEAQSGEDIPDLRQPQGTSPNVAGWLRTIGETLRFSLQMAEP